MITYKVQNIGGTLDISMSGISVTIDEPMYAVERYKDGYRIPQEEGDEFLPAGTYTFEELSSTKYMYLIYLWWIKTMRAYIGRNEGCLYTAEDARRMVQSIDILYYHSRGNTEEELTLGDFYAIMGL